MGGEKHKITHQRVGKRKATTERVSGLKAQKMEADVNGKKRKASTERAPGYEKRMKSTGKSVRPSLKVDVQNVPPSRQSSIRKEGVKGETGSAVGNKAAMTLPSKKSKRT